MARRTVALIVLVVAAGCHESRPPPAPKPVGESAQCRGDREAILQTVRESQQRRCESDGACATVSNPGSPVREYRLVVNAVDQPVIEGLAAQHLQECGAFIHHEAIDAIRVVSARCIHDRCAEHETVLHVE